MSSDTISLPRHRCFPNSTSTKEYATVDAPPPTIASAARVAPEERRSHRLPLFFPETASRDAGTMSTPAPESGSRTADDVLAIIKALSKAERARLFRALDHLPGLARGTGYVILPEEVLTMLQKVPSVLLKETVPELLRAVDLLGKRLSKRNRKSDPEIVRRNVEICDRRKQDRKKWSISRLARIYDLSHRNINLILKDEQKWRRLAEK